MQRMTSGDLDQVVDHYRGMMHRSYFYLPSLHGNSRSEFHVMLEDATARQWISRAPAFLMSVHEIDTVQDHARIQLCCRDAAIDLGADMPKLIGMLQVKRLYSYLFPDEVAEQISLSRMGFEREAVFRHHVFMNGGYVDVLVYGLTGALA